MSASLFYTQGIDNIARMDITQITAVGTQRLSTSNELYSKGSEISLQIYIRLNLEFPKKTKANL